MRLSTSTWYLSAIKQLMHQQVRLDVVLGPIYEVDTLVFDKTGTITTSRLAWQVIPFHGYSAEDLSLLALHKSIFTIQMPAPWYK